MKHTVIAIHSEERGKWKLRFRKENGPVRQVCTIQPLPGAAVSKLGMRAWCDETQSPVSIHVVNRWPDTSTVYVRFQDQQNVFEVPAHQWKYALSVAM